MSKSGGPERRRGVPVTRNLVIVMIDTLRQPGVTPWLEFEHSMPFLADLARRGLVFTNAAASSSWTVPSHYSFFTGQSPWSVAFDATGQKYLLPSRTTLADTWRSGGGRSLALSTNPIVDGESGLLSGYDSINPGLSLGVATSAIRLLEESGYERLLSHTLSRRSVGRGGRFPDGLDAVVSSFGFLASRAISNPQRNLLPALNRALRGRDSSVPIHVFLNMMEPHEPYVLPRARASPDHNGRFLPTWTLAFHSRALTRLTDLGQALRNQYVQAVREVDEQLRRVFTTLAENGVLNDALVVVLSDHGQAFGEHEFYGHGRFLYDELIRIPVIALGYAGGRPRAWSCQIHDWVDHTRLHAWISRWIADQAGSNSDGVPCVERLSAAPATTYWEGPPLHQPLLDRSSGRPPSYMIQRLRVLGQSGSVEASNQDADFELRGSQGLGGVDGELVCKAAERAVYELRHRKNLCQTQQEQAEVVARLTGWGYT